MPSANILEIKFITPGMLGLQYVKRRHSSTWKLGLHPSVGQSVVIIQLTSPVVFDIIGFTPFAPISYILTFDWRWCGMFHYQFPGFIGRQSILSTSFSPYCLITLHGPSTCHSCDTKWLRERRREKKNIIPPFRPGSDFLKLRAQWVVKMRCRALAWCFNIHLPSLVRCPSPVPG